MELEIRDIHKSFGENEVLHGISFNVQSGRAGTFGQKRRGQNDGYTYSHGRFHANSGQILIDGKPFRAERHKIGNSAGGSGDCIQSAPSRIRWYFLQGFEA